MVQDTVLQFYIYEHCMIIKLSRTLKQNLTNFIIK